MADSLYERVCPYVGAGVLGIVGAIVVPHELAKNDSWGYVLHEAVSQPVEYVIGAALGAGAGWFIGKTLGEGYDSLIFRRRR